jgi:hypothetical protein
MTDETLIANIKEVGQHLVHLAKEAKARGIETRVPAGSVGLTAGESVEVLKRV